MSEATETPQQERYRVTQRVTLVGAIVNTILAGVKILLGTLGNSQALVADGVHSLADLVSDGVVLLASKHSNREADDGHPYGHGRIETVVAVGLGVFLMGVAVTIGLDAISRIAEPERLFHPGWLALVGALFSIGANEWLYHYTVRAARRVHSKLLHANAWHHRSDAFSSVIALVGIGGTMAGLPLLDAIAAIGVSLLIAKVGWNIAWSSLLELIDTALEGERVERIRDAILTVDGVKEAHSLRTRSMGGQAFVDVHILVNYERMSVSEGHQISEAVRAKLLKDIDEVSDVVVHIDPEDDETSRPSSHLPLRSPVIKKLNQYWQNQSFHESIKRINLHYLDGSIHVDVFLPLEFVDQHAQIDAQLNDIVATETDIAAITVFYTDAPQ